MEKNYRNEEKNIENKEGYMTRDDFQKKFIEEDIKKRGIDISSDEYYKDERFKMLEKEPMPGTKISKSWWVEKNLVGQDRLKKIYGIYAMGIEHEYSEEELKRTAWMGELKDRYFDAKIKTKEEFARTQKDIEQYFFRRETEKSSGAGLVERLEKWGLDIKKFNGFKAEIEKIKLLHFLYCFEFDNKVKIYPFLSNPTLENEDNTFVGVITRNGELMACLKNNLLKEIDWNYAEEVDEKICDIVTLWVKWIMRIRSIQFMDDLTAINADLEWVLSIIGTPFPYEDSLLETFYLKLSLHEMTGRELDVIDVSDKYSVEEKELEEYRLKKFEELPENGIITIDWREGAGQYETVFDYIKNHRKILTQCVFGKENVDSNDYKKLDRAVGGLGNFLNFLKDNTPISSLKGITVLLIVSYLQVAIFIDKKKKIENPFYRHTVKDKRTFNTEIRNGRDALRKSQFAWKEKVMAQYDINIKKEQVRRLQREAEHQMDLLLVKVYESNSLSEMVCTGDNMLLYIEIFVGRMGSIRNTQEILKRILNKEKYRLSTENESQLHMFLGTLDEAQFTFFLTQIQQDVAKAERTNEKYTQIIEYKANADFDSNLEVLVYVELLIEPQKKEVKIEQWKMKIIKS